MCVIAGYICLALAVSCVSETRPSALRRYHRVVSVHTGRGCRVSSLYWGERRLYSIFNLTISQYSETYLDRLLP